MHRILMNMTWELFGQIFAVFDLCLWSGFIAWQVAKWIHNRKGY